MRARSKLWLVLLVLALVAVGAVIVNRQSEKPKPATVEPVAAPTESPPVRRTRPRARRSAQSQSIDAEIVATIRRNQSGVRICYERALKRDEGLAMKLDVHVRVRSTGVVDQVSFDGPAGPAALTDCIRNVIKTWQFPRAPESYRSTFPLRLQPSR